MRSLEDGWRSVRPLPRPGDGDKAEKEARQIAEEIWGVDEVDPDWYPDCPLRSKVRRRIKRARYLMEGGYLKLAAQW